MNKSIAIAKRELKSYFDSPIAYIVIVTFLLVTGWMVFSTLFLRGRADLRALFDPELFSPFLSPAALLVILAPAITMRLVAEERKTGTIELISSMPIRASEIILGKFLAALGLTAIAILSTFAYALTISFIGPLEWNTVISGYLGLILFSASLLAIGLLCSSFTDNQIVAFIISFIVCAVLYYIHWLHFFVPEWMAEPVDFIAVSSHLKNMARGVIDSRDIIYYLSLIGGSLFLAERALARQQA